MDIVPTFAVATSGEEDGAAVPPVSQQHPGIEQEDQKKLLHDGNALKSCISIAPACLSMLQRLKLLSRVREAAAVRRNVAHAARTPPQQAVEHRAHAAELVEGIKKARGPFLAAIWP